MNQNKVKFSVGDAEECIECLCWLSLNGLLEYSKMAYNKIIEMIHKNTVEACIPDLYYFNVPETLKNFDPGLIGNKKREISYFEEKKSIDFLLAIMASGYMPVDKENKPSIKSAAKWITTVLIDEREATAVSWGTKILFIGYPENIRPVKIPVVIELNTMATEENYQQLINCGTPADFMRKRNSIIKKALGNEIPALLLEVEKWFLETLEEY